jgi:hypothetical protein
MIHCLMMSASAEVTVGFRSDEGGMGPVLHVLAVVDLQVLVVPRTFK